MSSATENTTRPGFAFITLDRLTPNDYNARRFAQNMTPQRQSRFVELTASIKEKGIIEPLLVRPREGGMFEVIAGERRYRAAVEASLALGIALTKYEAPCMVRDVSDDEAFDLMLIENLQRDDLTPYETAQAFQAYLERHPNRGEAVNELSLRTGVPAWAIRRQMRLLALPPEVLAAWHEGKISQSHLDALTRVDDHNQVLELFAACVRLKLSTRELAERIGTMCPDVDKGFFDKYECQVCHYNSSVQSGLFAESGQAGKCGNAACFEAKQAAFLTANWLESKACAAFGTRGFRFGHRLGAERCEPIMFETSAERCLACDRFVSILRLNGAVVSGYAKACTGPAACFNELYREAPPVADAPEPRQEQQEEEAPATAAVPAQPAAKPAPTPPVSPPPAATPPAKKSPPAEETGPVYSAQRGERHREKFFREALPEKVSAAAVDDPQVQRLSLLALALASPVAKKTLTACIGIAATVSADDLAVKVFDEMPSDEVLSELRAATLAHILDPAVAAGVRRVVAGQFGIKLETEWPLNKAYLEDLTKGEIVRVGEEPGVDIWKDEKVAALKKERHKGKALLSLSREELIDLVMKSGAELKGRVPAEVLGQRGK